MSDSAVDPAAPRLLATKLHAPRRRRSLVERPRLTDRLVTAALPPLTIVAAPAGFGKTTLLTDWFAGAGDPGRATAWLSLDARDNDPIVFWSYVIAAVQTACPEAGHGALALLRSSQPQESVVGSLLDDLAHFAGHVVVVFDDYHVIESVQLHETITFLVDHLPPRTHVVLGSRTDPPLPLARLRVAGDLLEIRAADLRFTRDEAGAYLNDSMGLRLTSADVDALEARTEGWIAALQLAALSMQDRDDTAGFIASFTGDDRFVVDYLAEEVLERQPDDVRDFLLRTAIMDRFTGSSCDAVTGGVGGRAMLERLDRANLFLVALDDRRHWYRYHHLFADVLRARLLDEDRSLVDELHLRASQWYDQNDDPVEAISHAMAGQHHERAAELIELAAPQLRRQRREGTLRRWLEDLPHDTFVDRPVLAMALVGARMTTGDSAGVEALLATIEAALARPDRPPIYLDRDQFDGLAAQVQVQRAGLALLAGDVDATIVHATRVLDLAEPSDHFRRGSATALLALAHWTAGDLDTAERRYHEAIDALTTADHLADMLGCSLALADIQIAKGRLTAAERTFASGLRWTTDHPGLRGAADMHAGLSEVLIERNELEAAAGHLQISTELGESAGLPQHAYRWRVTMARLCRARGDLPAALELIDEAAPLYDTDFSPPVRPVAAIRARVQLACGDVEAARRWVTERGLAVTDDLSYLREYEHVTLARVLIAPQATSRDRASLEEALTLLNRMLRAADVGGRTGSAIEILILQATAHHSLGDDAAAVVALEDALRRAEPEGHVRLFLHAGPGVTELLRSATSRAPATPLVRAILAATPTAAAVVASPTARAPAPGLVDDLSARELEVLRLLRSDLSGPDIAKELVVSVNTVRTHTKNIYSKLGVNNRREAVRRADELGL